MGTLYELNGTRWAGTAELWLDPLGDDVVRGECTVSVDDDVVRYTWSHEGKSHEGKSHEGKSHEGSITLREDDAEFMDSWHQPQPMTCRRVADAWGLFQVLGEYGPQSEWRWRTGLSLRAPTDELVLQMTNIAPWGEEARAVRMICTRQ